MRVFLSLRFLYLLPNIPSYCYELLKHIHRCWNCFVLSVYCFTEVNCYCLMHLLYYLNKHRPNDLGRLAEVKKADILVEFLISMWPRLPVTFSWLPPVRAKSKSGPIPRIWANSSHIVLVCPHYQITVKDLRLFRGQPVFFLLWLAVW